MAADRHPDEAPSLGSQSKGDKALSLTSLFPCPRSIRQAEIHETPPLHPNPSGPAPFEVGTGSQCVCPESGSLRKSRLAVPNLVSRFGSILSSSRRILGRSRVRQSL